MSPKSLTNAVGLAGQLSGAINLLECDIWVVGVLEPVESPVAACLELLGETVAIRARGDTAVLLAPTLRRSTPLGSAGIEDTHTTTGHGKIEVVLSEVTAGVGGLHDHLLAAHGSGREGQLVAGAAPSALGLTRQLDSSKTIGEVIVDGPRALVGTHVRLSTTLTAVLSSHVTQWVVGLIA